MRFATISPNLFEQIKIVSVPLRDESQGAIIRSLTLRQSIELQQQSDSVLKFQCN